MRYFGFFSIVFGLISFILVMIFIPETNLLISTLLFSAIGIRIVINYSNEFQISSDINQIIKWLGYAYFAIALSIVLCVFSYQKVHSAKGKELMLSSEKYRKEIQAESMKNPLYYLFSYRIGGFGTVLITSISFFISNYIFNSFGRPRLTKRQIPLIISLYKILKWISIVSLILVALGIIISVNSPYLGKLAVIFVFCVYSVLDFSKRMDNEYSKL